eukprot:TRINITY_DN10968_c0_g1_i4.p1 TRINITY_DN10968_c0_g1~~TRINITY_DN10968_c0_g1_i4.p1  ORF type:complete len:393 (-),score=70.92 TRINITY_DN10968_c0_g1_i4:667-1677(-)
MVSHGSDGDTRKELQTVLGSSLEDIGQHLRNYNSRLREVTAVTLQVANSTWIADDYHVLHEYSETIKSNYEAEAFSMKPGDESVVNNWCSDKTKKMISSVLSPGTISLLTKLLLVNAIYFKGTWKIQFDKENTREDTFHARDKELTLPFMSLPKTNHLYKKAVSYQAVILKYGRGADNSFASVIVLPNDNESLDVLTEELGSQQSQELFFGGFSSKEGFVTLPRFQVEWGTKSVKKALELQGLNVAFSDKANFSLLSEPPDLAIADVLHKAVLKVNEEGAEAAAVTVVQMKTRCAVRPSSQPFHMKMDRPFLFAIVDMASLAVLFLGRIEEPSILK